MTPTAGPSSTLPANERSSQAVARWLGATIEGKFDLFGDIPDVWVTRGEVWSQRLEP